jgi:lysophospholipase L1-like esterase
VIVAFGDSITFGQHIDQSKAWPNLLRGREVTVAGIPGDTTRLGLERFPAQVQNVEPDIVIIQFGHNDCNRWETDRGMPRVSLAAYRANLNEMIDRSRVFNIKVMLCTLTPSLRSNRHAVDVEVYDRMLRTVASDEAVPLADVRAVFSEWPRLAVLLMPDGLHLTEDGHRLYARTVEEALAKAGWK